VTINRGFYELLRLYAVYLNNHEGLLEKHYQALKTFATCPSPYLTKPASKRYTLVLDLDETLVHSHRDKQRLEIFMRPFLKQFLEVMARNYELVVFTSSMPDYSEGIIAQLPHVAHRLYRYHTTRLRHRHIKDLSRLGRPLEAVVMVDNEEENFVLQKENGIRIAEWTGDDPHDQELNTLGLFLNELATKAVPDLRQHLSSYKQFRNSRQ
jgi:RNA polymerase II subunit A small phosphatase-like protein